MLLEGIGFHKRPFKIQQTHTQRIVGRRDELVDLLNKGTSLRLIAEHFGVSRGLIQSVLKELGLRSKHTGCISQWAHRQDELLAMLREGMSRGEIAKKLGVTRNVIVGACYRLGLSADAQVQEKILLLRQMAQKTAARRHRDRQLRQAKKFREGVKKKANPMKPALSPWRFHMRAKAPPPDSATRCMLMDRENDDKTLRLRAGRCHYIVDDDGPFYCGAPSETDTSSWCPYHAQFVFQNRTVIETRGMSGDVGGSLAVASRTGVESPCSPANATRPHQIQETTQETIAA